VTAFEITKNRIISPKAGKQMYRIFIRERKKFILPAMNEIWFVMSENCQNNCNFEGYLWEIHGKDMMNRTFVDGR
jgi:hypothetical protein